MEKYKIKKNKVVVLNSHPFELLGRVEVEESYTVKERFLFILFIPIRSFRLLSQAEDYVRLQKEIDKEL